jgi:hypothetical protein
MKSPKLEANAAQYAATRGIKVFLGRPLGDGTDGNVYPTNRNSALKALELEKTYLSERNCYQRLMEHGVERIEGLAVPRLIDFDDALQVVEIEIVQPPYLLDFGKAYLDQSSPFTQEQLASYEASLASHFRIDDVPLVKKVCRILRSYGIEYLDAKPKNIRLRNEEDERKLPDDDWDKEPPTDYSGYELDE